MLDLLYVGLTLAFFALMLAYVAGCAQLGRAGAPMATTASDASPDGGRQP